MFLCNDGSEINKNKEKKETKQSGSYQATRHLPPVLPPAGAFDRPPPEGLPVVLGQPPAFPWPRPPPPEVGALDPPRPPPPLLLPPPLPMARRKKKKESLRWVRRECAAVEALCSFYFPPLASLVSGADVSSSLNEIFLRLAGSCLESDMN